MKKLTDAVRKDLKSLEFRHKPRGPFGIGVSMTLKPGRTMPVHRYRERKLQTNTRGVSHCFSRLVANWLGDYQASSGLGCLRLLKRVRDNLRFSCGGSQQWVR